MALSTVEAIFVHSLDDRVVRRAVWQDWLAATALLRSIVPVCAVWVGGSFISTKPDPDDIDAVYLIKDEDILDLRGRGDPRALGVFESFRQGKDVRSRTGLAVDTYVLAWRPNPELGPRDVADRTYTRIRGQWDDFWQRMRSGSKHDPPVAEDCLPRRGYVEVMLDGFTV